MTSPYYTIWNNTGFVIEVKGEIVLIVMHASYIYVEFLQARQGVANTLLFRRFNRRYFRRNIRGYYRWFIPVLTVYFIKILSGWSISFAVNN